MCKPEPVTTSRTESSTRSSSGCQRRRTSSPPLRRCASSRVVAFRSVFLTFMTILSALGSAGPPGVEAPHVHRIKVRLRDEHAVQEELDRTGDQTCRADIVRAREGVDLEA